jgi:hypothetical protein
VFEDAEKAMELSCEKNEGSCDLMDQTYPFEDYLVPVLVYNVVKELLGAAYRPLDSYNDNTDNLSQLANFLRSNLKSSLIKQMEQ